MKMVNLEQALEEFRNGTYDFTKDGVCVKCGACCTNFLPMTEREIRIIKAYVKRNGIKPHDHSIPFAKKSVDWVCPFMDGGKEEKCDIYKVRPRICQLFICDPKRRKHFKDDDGMRTIDVRETFFGGNQ